MITVLLLCIILLLYREVRKLRNRIAAMITRRALDSTAYTDIYETVQTIAR